MRKPNNEVPGNPFLSLKKTNSDVNENPFLSLKKPNNEVPENLFLSVKKTNNTVTENPFLSLKQTNLIAPEKPFLFSIRPKNGVPESPFLSLKKTNLIAPENSFFSLKTTESPSTNNLFANSIGLYKPQPEVETKTAIPVHTKPKILQKNFTQSGDPIKNTLMFLNKLESDVTFKVENQEFPAHKSILSERCKFFKNMFSSKFISLSS